MAAASAGRHYVAVSSNAGSYRRKHQSRRLRLRVKQKFATPSSRGSGDDFAHVDGAGRLAIGNVPAVGAGGLEPHAGAIAGAGELVVLFGFSRLAQRQEEQMRLAAAGACFDDGGRHGDIVDRGLAKWNPSGQEAN